MKYILILIEIPILIRIGRYYIILIIIILFLCRSCQTKINKRIQVIGKSFNIFVFILIHIGNIYNSY